MTTRVVPPARAAGRRGAVRRLAIVAGALSLAACLDLSGPTDDIESLSALQPPYPAVIAGDTLRDSLGIARRLEVTAFSGRGDTVPEPEGLRFLLADTGTGVRIENGYLIAGAKLGRVRLVAQVPGLQTQPAVVDVVPRPTMVRPVLAATNDTVTLATKSYGLQPSLSSDPLQVRVVADGGAASADVNGWIVRYVIVRQPPAIDGGVTPAYLAADGGRAIRGDSATAIDTTAAGIAGRQVVIRPFLMRNPTDTVVVEAHVRLHGVALPGSPVVFRVPFGPAP